MLLVDGGNNAHAFQVAVKQGLVRVVHVGMPIDILSCIRFFKYAFHFFTSILSPLYAVNIGIFRLCTGCSPHVLDSLRYAFDQHFHGCAIRVVNEHQHLCSFRHHTSTFGISSRPAKHTLRVCSEYFPLPVDGVASYALVGLTASSHC